MSLCRILSPYLSKVHTSDLATSNRAIAHFVVFSDYREYRSIVSALPLSIRDTFYREVRDTLRSSFDAHRAWRALFWMSKTGCKMSEAVLKFEACADDIRYIWRSMSEQDRADVREVSVDFEDFYMLSKDDLLDLVKKINRHAGHIAYLRLRYVSDNDRSLTLDDLRGELLAHGLQVIRKYERTGSLKQMENYAKAGIDNHAVNMQHHYNSEKRATLRNITEKCNTCIFCLTGKSQKCRHAIQCFGQSTLSLSSQVSPKLKKDIHVALTSSIDVAGELESTSFISFMHDGLDTASMRVFDIITKADADLSFEVWLEETKKITVDSLMDKPQRLLKLYCTFLQVPVANVLEDIDKRYRLYQEQNVA